MKLHLGISPNCYRAAVVSLTFLACSTPVVAQQARGELSLVGGFRIAALKAYRPIGGAGNNLEHPNLSAVAGSPEIALAPLDFAPGPGNQLVPGPNPRTVSNVISGGTGAAGNNAESTDPTLSAWLYVFGQFVDHDIDLEATPLSDPHIDVVVPAGDPVYKAGTVIAMTRDARSPFTNTILNTVAGYLNLSQLYGQTPAIAASLENPDGTLRTSGNGEYLPIVSGLFVSGDPRVMENPELTAVTTLFMREHNYWVRTIAAQTPGMTGSQLYDLARAITTAEYQNIIYSAYLPHLIGPILGPYQGYDPFVNPQVSQEFATAAFRLHTQVSDTQEGLDENGNVVFSESLAQAFFNTAATDETNGVDNLLRSLGADYAQATDVYTVSVLRDLLNAGLVGGGHDLIDLMAIDIQRERDVGLSTLDGTRFALRLPPYGSFAQLTPDPVLQQSFGSLYGNIGNVDLFMGGLAEPHAPGAAVGPTFQAIIADQFGRLRLGDRFFWLNQGFDPHTAAAIAATTLGTLLARDTSTTTVQSDVFVEAPYPGHVKAHIRPPLPPRT